jgi:hypothetical protein
MGKVMGRVFVNQQQINLGCNETTTFAGQRGHICKRFWWSITVLKCFEALHNLTKANWAGEPYGWHHVEYTPMNSGVVHNVHNFV